METTSKKGLAIDSEILEGINPDFNSEIEDISAIDKSGGEEKFFSQIKEKSDENKDDRRENSVKTHRTQYHRRGFEKKEEEEEFVINKDKIISLNEIKVKDVNELIDIAKSYEINLNRMSKNEIIYSILLKAFEKNESVTVEGILDISEEGFGFIKYLENNYKNSPYDVYVPTKIIRIFSLRKGDSLDCFIKPPRKNERCFSVAVIKEINQQAPNNLKNKINFENLVPIFPTEKFNFESKQGKSSTSTRIIDLICSVGKGQRQLIVAPPRTGKTELMKAIAEAISINHPEVKIISLNIDERPEEATDMQRSIKGEVICSTFDEPAQRHVNIAEITIERAKRLVEQGFDVVILLDSITRLARAYNSVAPSSGKVLSGGVDSNALHKPKKFFGAARNIENGGSLTIIATALVDTGSKMDEVIFEEFKGTGNSEIVLDRKIADRRIFPAIDILKSGTRKEDEMIGKDKLQRMWILRRFLTQNNNNLNQNSSESLEFLIKRINETESNGDLLNKMNSL